TPSWNAKAGRPATRLLPGCWSVDVDFWAGATALLFTKTNLLIGFGALLTDRLFGYPDWLYQRVRHPVVWIGAVINYLDYVFNRDDFSPHAKRWLGLLALVVTLVIVLIITLPLTYFLRATYWGAIAEIILAGSLISQHSLLKHVGAVASGLAQGLVQGRDAVRHIVGRDPDHLDESGVARGAIESLAENTSDGVVAPLFWLLAGGLPGLVLYKAVNTADSMIGYKSDRYRYFGTAAARMDDALNFPAARLSGLLFAMARALKSLSGAKASWRVMVRDADKHVSPNAGWPEAAMAGALDIRLGGPRQYDGRKVDLPWLGTGKTDLDGNDIRSAITLTADLFTLLAVLLGFALILGHLPN
ncbi:MAG: adenosylcobinamide-phosphate synthase CbiB, partial [Fimbriimonadaceae bacterium]|nr:adenosylcobinamide-phosphate synthase CbiB [Alphaproteobacteria bacterium]